MITRAEIEHQLRLIVQKISGNDPIHLAPERSLSDKSFRHDLDIDSLAMVELADEIEDRFGVKIPEEEFDLLRTFGDAVDYLSPLVHVG